VIVSAFFRKLRRLTEPDRREAELHEELQFHLEEEAEQRRAEGLSNEEARWAARRGLGSLTLVQEDTRAVWGWTILEQLGQDLRYAGRTMAANRLFTALVVVCLALGIGANTAIYSFLDAILLRSLPVADAESLVVLNWHVRSFGASRADGDFVMQRMSGSTWRDSKWGSTSGMFPFEAFELFQKDDAIFSSVFAYFQPSQLRKLNLAINGQANIASGVTVSGAYFRGLGVVPTAGRLIAPDDDRAGAPPVAVVSYALSEKRFGGAANAVGQAVLINNLPFTVSGVTPPGFFGVDPAGAPDVYVPMHANELLGAADQFGFRANRYFDSHYYWIQIMGRLRPGVSLVQAQAALAPRFQQRVARTATNDRQRAHLPELLINPGAGGLSTLRRAYSQALYVLMAMVGLILILACANVASLLLGRATTRRREIALRLSLGAGRSRIIRQLLTESVLLASFGGALGVLIAILGIRFLTLLLANGRSGFTLRAELNWHVLGVAAALSVLTGVLFGVAPAIRATRVDVIPALKEVRAGESVSRHRAGRVSLGQTLLAAQIAISVLMLVAAGLFVRTLSHLQAIEVGFNRDNVLLFQLDARKAGYGDQDIDAFYSNLLKTFSAIPGVRHASLSDSSLIEAGSGSPINVPGQPPDPATQWLSVGPGFFATMEIPVLAGRDLDEGDRPGSRPVAVVNEVFAKKNFGDRSPLGQHLILNRNGQGRDMEIVGVSRNARYGSLISDIPPVVYFPFDQGFPQPNEMVYALRTSGDPLHYANAVRETVQRANARVPVSEIRTQTADIDRQINQEITLARLCSGFAILATLIACVGLYGAVSYTVARRTGEIGIRIALGARRGGVERMVLREVLALVAAGEVIGLAAALAAAKFVESFLYGIKPNDPLALTLGSVTLLAAALLAGYMPARRASRIDPMVALRHD
jgi:macrolide transport system ATP-binding/permease protein